MSKIWKKLLAVALTASISAGAAVAGTIAYLQDTDSDVNVMTLGNVDIAQHEYERVLNADGTFEMVTSDKYGEGYKLQEFTQDKPLYPATGAVTGYGKAVYFDQLGKGASGGQRVLDGLNNVQDKFVLVENTGKSDAYVRTIVAFETGDLSAERWDEIIMLSDSATGEPWQCNDLGVAVIDGENYFICEYVYTGYSDGRHDGGILPAGEYTYASLAQVYMASKATNDDVAAIDGNGNGKYDILVVSQAIQTAGFGSAEAAFAAGFPVDAVALADWFGGAIDKYEKEEAAKYWDDWDSTVDTSWYNETDTEFTLDTAEKLAGLAKLVDDGNTFAGKTIQMGINMDMKNIIFDPIGSYRNETSFKGTFDGQGHIIKNLSQNTWALDNGYEYGDLGLGLLGKVEDATIKNLVMDGASISGESAICGTVAATAYGDCTFENITVKNSEIADYQYYAGGIVGWASGNHTYKNINVEASTTVGSQWGDFGNANGGIIGGIGSSAKIHFEDCTVACRIDATNDVVSAYQWYNYRNSGMLIGRVPQTITNGEVQTVATPVNVTCKNVTVIYDDWANYTYCEFAGTGYPYVRVQAGTSVDAYSNVRYGHPTDANGNTVVDDNHVHNEGEDHQVLIEFDQLFGGPADHRYCYYGIKEFDGVTVIYNNK